MIAKEALQFATSRVTDFALVNNVRPDGDRQNSIGVWMEGLGFSDELEKQLAEWCDDFCGEGWTGPIMMGVAIGLFIREYNEEQ